MPVHSVRESTEAQQDWLRFELVLQSTHTSYIQMSMKLYIVDILGPMLTSYFITNPLILNMLEFAAFVIVLSCSILAAR